MSRHQRSQKADTQKNRPDTEHAAHKVHTKAEAHTKADVHTPAEKSKVQPLTAHLFSWPSPTTTVTESISALTKAAPLALTNTLVKKANRTTEAKIPTREKLNAGDAV